MLFDDGFIEKTRAARASPVNKALRSDHARAGDASRRAVDGSPLHGFRTLLQHLGTVACNITSTSLNPDAGIVIITRPAPTRAKAFKRLDANPACSR
jgi:hypothetical protein